MSVASYKTVFESVTSHEQSVVESSIVIVVVVTFFNHNFVNCKATLIWRLKIYETKYNMSLNDVDT